MSARVAALGDVPASVSHAWPAMGTDCRIVVVGEADVVWAGAGRGVVLVDRLERRWSRFRVDSDVSRINAASGRPVPVARETLDAVDAALDARRRTDGRFDPTVLAALVAAGYDRTFEEVSAGVPASGGALPRPAGARVDVDRQAGTVAVQTGAGVDLGGIGKGLAADLVCADVLARPGVDGVCVDLGGDVRVAGRSPSDAGWGIEVDDPFHPGGRPLALIALEEGAVCTSTTARRRWRGSDGDVRHHVIDPATGSPATTPVVAATAVAGAAAEAEIDATLALLTGDPGELGIVVHHEGHATISPGLGAFLR